jgi:hypothetical protein
LSRLRLTLALAVLVAVATALAACGGSDNSDKSPEAVIENATLAGIQSADLDLSLNIEASGKEGGNVEVSLSGPFTEGAEGSPPQLDMDAKVSGKMNGEDVDFDGGLVLLPNSAYVNYEGTEYEVDPTTYSFVESAIKQSQQQGNAGEGSGASACEDAASGIDIASFADNLANEGTADVGGTSTTKLSGDLDVSAGLAALVEVTEDPACRSQLGAAGVPSASELAEAKQELGKAVKTAHVDLYVGDDDIVRRITVELDLAPESDGGSPERVRASFDLTLTGVNEEQEISAPGSARPLSDLFVKLGVNPLELAGALQGGDLGGLLEGLNGDVGGLGGLPGLESGSTDGGSGEGGASGGFQSYSDCIRSATSAADLQKCAELL